jgi:hypothetical protein
VGTGKDVTANLALTGAQAGNYGLSSRRPPPRRHHPTGITGNFTASNKVYDGNASANVTNRTLNGTVTGDTVSLTGGDATFSDKNVGTGKTVTLTGATLGGTDAGNYNLTSGGYRSSRHHAECPSRAASRPTTRSTTALPTPE